MPDNLFKHFIAQIYNFFLMKRFFLNNFFLTILIFSGLIIYSCKDRDGTSDCFPQQYIYFHLPLSLPNYQQLQFQGNYEIVNIEGSGSRGVIIYNTGTKFIIYDRNAPHLCPDENTTLEVITDTDGFKKLYCPKDGSKWLLENGQPLEKVSTPPKMYRYYLQNNILNVYN